MEEPLAPQGGLFGRCLSPGHRWDLGTIELLRQEIERVSLTIASQAQQDPRALRLTELYGIGYYLALLIVAEIGDIKMDGDCLLIRGIPGFP